MSSDKEDLLSRADALMKRRRSFVAGRRADAGDDLPVLTDIIPPSELPAVQPLATTPEAMAPGPGLESVKSEIASHLEMELSSRIQEAISARLQNEFEARVESEVSARAERAVAARLEAAVQERLAAELPHQVATRVSENMAELADALEARFDDRVRAAVDARLQEESRRLQTEAALRTDVHLAELEAGLAERVRQAAELEALDISARLAAEAARKTEETTAALEADFSRRVAEVVERDVAERTAQLDAQMDERVGRAAAERVALVSDAFKDHAAQTLEDWVACELPQLVARELEDIADRIVQRATLELRESLLRQLDSFDPAAVPAEDPAPPAS